MASYQKMIIVGNLGRDPEMRYMPNGNPVTQFSVAVETGGKENKSTLWFKVAVFGNQAEPCNQYLKKGSRVMVDGRLTGDAQSGGPRLWKDNTGETRASFEMSAEKVVFLDRRADGQNGEDTSF